MPEMIEAVRLSWDERAAAMNADLSFEKRFVQPFAYAPALLLARRANLGSLLESPRSVTEIGSRARMSTAAARSLLQLLMKMGLVEPIGENYGATISGKRLLSPLGGPEFMEPAFRFLRIIGQPLGSIFTDEVDPHAAKAILDWPPSNALAAVEFEALMTATAPYVATWLDELMNWAEVTNVLDVGGGDGTVTAMLCAKHAALNATVFNLPWATGLVQSVATEYDLHGRLTACAGDFRQDDLPRPFDLVLFSRMLSDWDDVVVQKLLTEARAALRPGGRVIALESTITDLAEPSSETDPHLWEIFWQLLIPGLQLHGPRSSSEWRELASGAGLGYRIMGRCGRLPFPELTAIEFTSDR